MYQCHANYNWEASLRKHPKFNHFMVYSRTGPPRPMAATEKIPLVDLMHRAQKRGRIWLRRRDQVPIPGKVFEAADAHSSSEDGEDLLTTVAHEPEAIQEVVVPSKYRNDAPHVSEMVQPTGNSGSSIRLAIELFEFAPEDEFGILRLSTDIPVLDRLDYASSNASTVDCC